MTRSSSFKVYYRTKKYNTHIKHPSRAATHKSHASGAPVGGDGGVLAGQVVGVRHARGQGRRRHGGGVRNGEGRGEGGAVAEREGDLRVVNTEDIRI